MSKKIPRTRNDGQWTEARYFSFIRTLLRSGWNRWGPRNTAKRAAKVAYNTYECAHCGGWFGTREVELDHVVPCGSLRTFDDLPGFVERMFCEAEGFQVLCKPCHQVKTNEESNARKRSK